ncbi:MAG: hypothetical protein AAFY60_16830, partial [Myxococcota bacterium]
PDGAHYFLEVNTRLQVEHPVTESLIGLDIVRAQIDVAHGGALPDVVPPRGHSIEARLNAEDPYAGFLPQTGEVLMLQWPTMPGVRIDSGLAPGLAISPHYDSLVAKVIVHAEDREAARQRLLCALKELTILGITTNQRFLIDLLDSEVFKSGETYTTSVEEMVFEAPKLPEALAELGRQELERRSVSSVDGDGGDRYAPWESLGAFRMGEA